MRSSIRSFDVATNCQLKQKKITIIPNVEIKFFKKIEKVSWLYLWENGDFHPKYGGFAIRQFLQSRRSFWKLSKDIKHYARAIILNQGFIKKAVDFRLVELSSKDYEEPKKFEFHIQPQPSSFKQFDLLLNNLSENHFNGFKNYLFCSNDAQAKRFHDILKL
jgi:transcription-repair coupling factor (superfamily II helicase)